MAIPKKVREQAEEAERLAQEHFQKPPENDGFDDTPPANPAPANDPQPAQDNWEKRFKGLKKTYDKTVHDMRKQIADLTETIDAMRKAPPAPASPTPQTATGAGVSKDDIFSVRTETERDEYSPEFIDMVARLASRVAGTAAAPPPEIESRLENIERRQVKSAEDQFWDDINKAVPNWKALQKTEDMQSWLLEHDDLLGTSRDEAIAQAQQNLDSSRVIAIFKSYTAPAKQTVYDDPQADLIHPDEGAGDGGTPPSSGQRMWKVSEVQNFYKRLALGKFKGQDGRKRAMQIEKSIEKAREEGRIIEG